MNQWAGKRAAVRRDCFSIWLHQPMRRDVNRPCTKGDEFLICTADRRASCERRFCLAAVRSVGGVSEMKGRLGDVVGMAVISFRNDQIFVFWNRRHSCLACWNKILNHFSLKKKTCFSASFPHFQMNSGIQVTEENKVKKEKNKVWIHVVFFFF